MRRRGLIVAVGVLLALAAVVAGLLLYLPYDSYPGETYETYQFSGSGLSIRVLAQHEKNYVLNFVPGAYLTFYARSGSAGPWVEVMQFRHDDPISIPKDNLRIVDSKVAYMFVGWKLASTSDGARSWSVWDGSKELPPGCADYGLIAKTDINSSGIGRMIVKTNRYYCKADIPQLTTADFGKTWRVAR